MKINKAWICHGSACITQTLEARSSLGIKLILKESSPGAVISSVEATGCHGGTAVAGPVGELPIGHAMQGVHWLHLVISGPTVEGLPVPDNRGNLTMKVGNAQFRREEAVVRADNARWAAHIRPVYSVTRNQVIPMSSNISRNMFRCFPGVAS